VEAEACAETRNGGRVIDGCALAEAVAASRIIGPNRAQRSIRREHPQVGKEDYVEAADGNVKNIILYVGDAGLLLRGTNVRR
jgi:hypothetical protein